MPQEYDPQLIEWLAADFPRRKDIALDLGLMDGLIANLPGIRGYWNFARMTYHPTLIDSINGLNCNRQSTAYQIAMNHVLAGYFNGGYAWWRNSESALNISGLDNYLTATLRGMYLGAWVYPATINTTRCFVAKRAAADNFQFQLKQVNARLDFAVSTDGVNWVTVSHATALQQSKWQFILGRFDPSSSLDIYLNGVWSTLAVGVPASIFAGDAPFTIGAYRTLVPGFAEYCSGYMANIFYGAADLPDRYVSTIYNWTRPLFGV